MKIDEILFLIIATNAFDYSKSSTRHSLIVLESCVPYTIHIQRVEGGLNVVVLIEVSFLNRFLIRSIKEKYLFPGRITNDGQQSVFITSKFVLQFADQIGRDSQTVETSTKNGQQIEFESVERHAGLAAGTESQPVGHVGPGASNPPRIRDRLFESGAALCGRRTRFGRHRRDPTQHSDTVTVAAVQIDAHAQHLPGSGSFRVDRSQKPPLDLAHSAQRTIRFHIRKRIHSRLMKHSLF